jgi:hypothetical protein
MRSVSLRDLARARVSPLVGNPRLRKYKSRARRNADGRAS